VPILTVKYIEALERRVRAGEKVKEFHGDGDGLYLRVLPSGRMSYEFRRRPFKPVKLGAAEMGLAHARQMAMDARVQQAKGIDPTVQKRAEKQVVGDTFEKVLTNFIERHAKPELRTWKNIDRGLRKDAVPVWGSLPIDSISRKMVGDLVDAIVDRGAPRQAALVYAYLHKFFAWAVGRGYLDANPAENLPKPRQKPSRERVLTDDELRMVWEASEALGWPFQPILRLLALTGQRKSEISAGKWSEIDMQARLWRLPALRVKNKSAHAFPLSGTALTILENLPRIEKCDFLFSTTKGETSVSGFSKAKTRLDAKVAELNGGEVIPDWSWHDLRRTAATGMASINIAPHVIEAVLNHKSGAKSGVAGVYNRHDYLDEMRVALDTWANRLDEIVTGEKAGNVLTPARSELRIP
jgi:integrase